MNKPKLNEPDVEATITTFNSTTGENITINKTIPSQQFKDIFVTGMSVEDQQTIVDFKQNHVELNIRENGLIKIEPGVITYNGKIYVAIDSPTFEEEIIQEANKLGYEYLKNDFYIDLTRGYKRITIDIEELDYSCFDIELEVDLSINCEEHLLLTKILTFLGGL